MTQTVPLADVLSEDFYVPSEPSDVRIHIRRKCSARGPVRGNQPVTLFVHGATYSGISAFDAPLRGGSWLDFAAAQGHDAYAIDIRGYGLSSRPVVDKSAIPKEQEPYARTVDAILDLTAAVDFVLALTNADCINLVGWSWGTAICGGYTSKNASKVRRLVLYAPIWTFKPPPGTGLPLSIAAQMWMPTLGALYASTLPSFRHVSLGETRRRWFRGLEPSVAETLCPSDELEAWWEHTLGTDPAGASRSPPVLSAPNGVLADLAEYWAAGVPTYAPEDIDVPVLAILGEWDIDTPLRMAQEIFERLISAPYKRLEVLGNGTHSMCLEANRFDLYSSVEHFLSAPLRSKSSS